MNNADLNFIVKTSFNCNLGCSYCYEGLKPKGQYISIKTVDRLIEQAANYSAEKDSHAQFIWHGGEPLLRGLDFFKHVVTAQETLGPSFKYTNIIQTNGVLLDDKFADFFADKDFHVGVSLDGPPAIHNAQRKEISGGATFEKVYDALVRMDDRGQRPSTIAIYTSHTHKNLDAFFDFFSERCLDVKVNPLLVAGSATNQNAINLRLTPQEYGKGMIHLFDRWIEEKPSGFKLDPLDSIVRTLTSGISHSCNGAAHCYDYFKVFPDGSMHLCGFQDYYQHTLGNINTNSIEQLLTSPERKSYIKIKAAAKEACSSCEHVSLCNGGCTLSAYTKQQNTSDIDYYCEGRKILYSHIKEVVPRRLPQSLIPLLQYTKN